MIILDLLVVFLFYCGLMYSPVLSILLLLVYYFLFNRINQLLLIDFLVIFLFIWIGSTAIGVAILLLLGYIWLKYKRDLLVRIFNKLFKDVLITLIDLFVVLMFLANIVSAPVFTILFVLGYCWLRSKYFEYEEKWFLKEVKRKVDETYIEFCNLTADSSDEEKFDQYLLLKESVESTLDIDHSMKVKILEIFDKKFKDELTV